jgi:hypothetical protein
MADGSRSSTQPNAASIDLFSSSGLRALTRPRMGMGRVQTQLTQTARAVGGR